jgi:chromosome segregation ATPase
MWPALVQLLQLAPHVTRLVPVADRYLQSKAESRSLQGRSLEEAVDRLRGDMGQMAEGMRGDFTQMAAAQADISHQLNQQHETLATIAADVRTMRLASDEIETRLTRMEARMQRLWMTFVPGMLVLAILAAVMIAMLLHIRWSLHGS